MSKLDEITDAIDACGLEWAMHDFAPRKAPQGVPYATVSCAVEYDGSDYTVMDMLYDVSIVLYDFGDTSLRDSLSRQLAMRGIHHRRGDSAYIYDLKLFATVYDVEDYYEKWSDEE